MKGRAQAIQRTRSSLSELQQKYGTALPKLEGESYLQQATRLGLIRTIIAGAKKTAIPCRLELKEQGLADPSLIVSASLPVELLPSHRHVAVGGQILSFARSRLALPKYIMDAAWRAQGSWKGEQFPVLVSIRSEYRYLVRPNSCFFRWREFVGDDLDQNSPIEPNETELQLGRYNWSEDVANELTVVLADI